jgi:hypothetical protein
LPPPPTATSRGVPLGKFRVFDYVRQIPELDYQFLLLFFSSPLAPRVDLQDGIVCGHYDALADGDGGKAFNRYDQISTRDMAELK